MIGLPKDAEGREIPLDTERLYDADGVPVGIRAFRYDPHERLWRVERSDGPGTPKTTALRFTSPDSWERLEEDLDRCIEESDPCWYFNKGGGDCSKCARPDGDTCGCTASVFKDIKKRIRELGGSDR